MNKYPIGGIIYLIVGLIVASNNGYLMNLTSFGAITSAALGILLWPLILFGANLHLAF